MRCCLWPLTAKSNPSVTHQQRLSKTPLVNFLRNIIPNIPFLHYPKKMRNFFMLQKSTMAIVPSHLPEVWYGQPPKLQNTHGNNRYHGTLTHVRYICVCICIYIYIYIISIYIFQYKHRHRYKSKQRYLGGARRHINPGERHITACTRCPKERHINPEKAHQMFDLAWARFIHSIRV